ncbi:C40 family peptidase [Blautia sp. 2744]|uniref:C40 family peptidase n=2 Tax=Blautia intestinalis TaxID=2763028 RepID=A0ABR7I0Z3_9FIRM|nr:NlpC/P60 family protein [Blautia intestinalis]MBC5740172.1 C40 family peptidase [Blautia intestinalis]RHD33108.1 hydrolase [Blautia obeum]
MKNKYLTKCLCMTILSAMVLTSPLSVMAAEEDVAVSSEGDNLGDGSEITNPGTDTPTPDPGTDTPTPDPGTDTPTPDPGTDTPTPDPGTDTPTPDPDPIDPTPTNPDTPTPNPDTPTPDPDFDDGSKSAAVQKLIDDINALAGQTLTLNQAAKVQELREIYNSISADQKKLVTNYNLLVDFESKIAELQKKQNADIPDFTDGSKASETGTPVYYVSNLHAGKEFYLDSLKGNYQLTFSDDFASVMNEIEAEYKEKNKLSDVSDNRSDGLTTSADSLLVRNWQDILAVYVYEQSQNGVKEFTLDASSKDELAKIFAQMNPIVRDKDNITHVSYGNYHINNYIKQNDISQNDRSVLKKYVETDCKLLCAIVTDAKGFVRQSVGDDVSEERVNVITAAYSLVGEVGYFWGGKSTTIGGDPSWGTAEKVSVTGSASTGTVRAYGLDCSGFVTWSVINGYLNQGMQDSVGDGTSDQWEKANVVSEQDAQPGDLVFQKGPEAGSDNHVGIICGKTDAGDWIAVHCSSSKNGVTVGEAYGASFRYIRQPSFYPTQEEVTRMESEGASASNAEAASAAETADTEKNLTAAPDETLTSETGAADETADDSSDEMEITIVDDDEDETFTSDSSAMATAPVNDVLQEILDQNVFDSSESEFEILPKKPDADDGDIEIVFED